MTHLFRDADLQFLNDYSNTEADPLRYSIEALLWLVRECRENREKWTVSVDINFLRGVEKLLLHFSNESDTKVQATAEGLRADLALWRNDVDATFHPLAHLGRILRGDPGEHLEYRGPIFLTTIDEVLEGIAHEHVMGEWDLSASAWYFLALCALSMGVIAQSCFWSTKGQGTNLDAELTRVFRREESRKALRGQLANLVVAGQALSWGSRVEFITESAGKTPDWVVGEDDFRLWVECTCSKARTAEFNSAVMIRDALATAWSSKKQKFVDPYRPGLLSCDISGLFCNREHRTLLRKDFLDRIDLPLASDLKRSIGIYRMRDDFDLLAQESFDRSPVGVLASALHSRHAVEQGIKGFLAYMGQEILVNTITHQIFRPQRGILAWTGELDASFYHAIRLCQSAIANQIEPMGIPTCYVHLV